MEADGRMIFVKGNHALVLLLATLVVFSFIVAPSAAVQDATSSAPRKRIGLVIGNGAYPLSAVSTAINDARAISALLREGGFDVIYLENAKRFDIESAIKQFNQKLQG